MRNARARASLERLLEGRRATARAKAALQLGDRLRVTRCGGVRATVTFDGWDPVFPNWICSRTRNDIHALSVVAVNGEPVSFADPPGFVAPKPTLLERLDYRYGQQVRKWRLTTRVWADFNLPHLLRFDPTPDEGDCMPPTHALRLSWRTRVCEFRWGQHAIDLELPF